MSEKEHNEALTKVPNVTDALDRHFNRLVSDKSFNGSDSAAEHTSAERIVFDDIVSSEEIEKKIDYIDLSRILAE